MWIHLRFWLVVLNLTWVAAQNRQRSLFDSIEFDSRSRERNSIEFNSFERDSDEFFLRGGRNSVFNSNRSPANNRNQNNLGVQGFGNNINTNRNNFQNSLQNTNRPTNRIGNVRNIGNNVRNLVFSRESNADEFKLFGNNNRFSQGNIQSTRPLNTFQNVRISVDSPEDNSIENTFGNRIVGFNRQSLGFKNNAVFKIDSPETNSFEINSFPFTSVNSARRNKQNVNNNFRNSNSNRGFRRDSFSREDNSIEINIPNNIGIKNNFNNNALLSAFGIGNNKPGSFKQSNNVRPNNLRTFQQSVSIEDLFDDSIEDRRRAQQALRTLQSRNNGNNNRNSASRTKQPVNNNLRNSNLHRGFRRDSFSREDNSIEIKLPNNIRIKNNFNNNALLSAFGIGNSKPGSFKQSNNIRPNNLRTFKQSVSIEDLFDDSIEDRRRAQQALRTLQLRNNASNNRNSANRIKKPVINNFGNSNSNRNFRRNSFSKEDNSIEIKLLNNNRGITNNLKNNALLSAFGIGGNKPGAFKQSNNIRPNNLRTFQQSVSIEDLFDDSIEDRRRAQQALRTLQLRNKANNNRNSANRNKQPVTNNFRNSNSNRGFRRDSFSNSIEINIPNNIGIKNNFNNNALLSAFGIGNNKPGAFKQSNNIRPNNHRTFKQSVSIEDLFDDSIEDRRRAQQALRTIQLRNNANSNNANNGRFTTRKPPSSFSRTTQRPRTSFSRTTQRPRTSFSRTTQRPPTSFSRTTQRPRTSFSRTTQSNPFISAAARNGIKNARNDSKKQNKNSFKSNRKPNNRFPILPTSTFSRPGADKFFSNKNTLVPTTKFVGDRKPQTQLFSNSFNFNNNPFLSRPQQSSKATAVRTTTRRPPTTSRPVQKITRRPPTTTRRPSTTRRPTTKRPKTNNSNSFQRTNSNLFNFNSAVRLQNAIKTTTQKNQTGRNLPTQVKKKKNNSKTKKKSKKTIPVRTPEGFNWPGGNGYFFRMRTGNSKPIEYFISYDNK